MSSTRRFEGRMAEAIEAAVPDSWRLLDDLAKTPELGFYETETSARLALALKQLGYQVESGLARTGLRATLAGLQPRPRIAVLGELDALPVPAHPEARRGIAHACGHHGQLATLFLIAAGLRPIAEALAGSVTFLAVPAEEFVDLERRLELRRLGEIEFLSGKAEFIRTGVFDDVDMAILVHATTRSEERDLAVGGRMNGMVAKKVRYIGRSSHAAASPHLGVNALSAAQIALAALNAVRERVRDEDHVRFHAIVTAGGESPNVIPDDVRLEAVIRAASSEALIGADHMAHRALRAGAVAMGAGCVIASIPGYLPLVQDPTLMGVLRRHAEAIIGNSAVAAGQDRAGSTDLGDLSHLMPVVQPWAGGMRGSLHSPDFAIVNRDVAIKRPAIAVASAIIELLGQAAPTTSLLAEFRPAMTKEDYLAYLRAAFAVDTVELEG